MTAGVFHGTYNAEKVIITFNSVIITGFTDGDFVTVKFDEDRYFKVKGTDGEVGRSRNPSKAGTAEITLMSTSAANTELSDILMTATESKVAPFSVKDLSGSSLAYASKAWIKTAPDFTRGMEVGETVWILDMADLEIQYGGTTDDSLISSIGL